MTSIRTKLLLLIASIFIPASIGAGYAVHHFQGERSREATALLTELVHGMADSVERELAVREALLRALALSPALRREDLRTFYAHARAAAPTFERTIVLSRPSGAQIVNTRLPLEARLPVRSSLNELRQQLKLAPDATLISDLYFAPVGKDFSFAVQVPVFVRDEVRYYLSMGTFTSTLQRLVDDRRLRAGWNASILDRTGVLVARRIRPQEFVGKPATRDMLERLSTAPAGVFETVRLDGAQVFTAYTPIGETGWTMVISMPKTELTAQSDALFRGAVAFVAALLLVALAIATVVARSIARSVGELVGMAQALGRAEPVPQPRTPMRETSLVAAELKAAGEKLRLANDTLESRVREAVRESERVQHALLQHQKLEALGRLTGGIAHDFNNILQTLSGSLELAARLAVVDSVKGALETGKRAVERGTQLTRQLLSFGRSAAGATATIDLADHVRQHLDFLRGALRERVDIVIALPDALWPVTLDPVQLDLALLNLALNARDAMPNGGKFEISARHATLGPSAVSDLAPGDYVCLACRDTGGGIDPGIVPRIFDPFFTTKETGKGSGLGLAQVYGFARQSGGTVTVDSHPAEGTVFTLYFPRARAPVEAVIRAAPSRKERRRPANAAVLFVDDDELIRRIMIPALQAEGFTVHTAADGSEALRVLESQKVDVILSDIVMPGGMSGVELARQASERYAGVRVVLMTGYTEQAPADVAFRILRKPYDIEHAIEAIRAELER